MSHCNYKAAARPLYQLIIMWVWLQQPLLSIWVWLPVLKLPAAMSSQLPVETLASGFISVSLLLLEFGSGRVDRTMQFCPP